MSFTNVFRRRNNLNCKPFHTCSFKKFKLNTILERFLFIVIIRMVIAREAFEGGIVHLTGSPLNLNSWIGIYKILYKKLKFFESWEFKNDFGYFVYFYNDLSYHVTFDMLHVTSIIT